MSLTFTQLRRESFTRRWFSEADIKQICDRIIKRVPKERGE